jgi:hypothetical protein
MPQNALASVFGGHHCANGHLPEDDDEDLFFLRVTLPCLSVYGLKCIYIICMKFSLYKSFKMCIYINRICILWFFLCQNNNFENNLKFRNNSFAWAFRRNDIKKITTILNMTGTMSPSLALHRAVRNRERFVYVSNPVLVYSQRLALWLLLFWNISNIQNIQRYIKPKKLPPIDSTTMCRAALCGLPPDRSFETACSDGRQQVSTITQSLTNDNHH